MNIYKLQVLCRPTLAVHASPTLFIYLSVLDMFIYLFILIHHFIARKIMIQLI
jgi:hypothetical protein